MSRKHKHKHRHARGCSDRWRLWREQQADLRHAARKTPRRNLSRRERLESHLKNQSWPKALHSVLISTLAHHKDDRNYDVVDALIEILTTLRPECDAVQDARFFASRAGVPVERLIAREDFEAWLDS